jgi:VWFA-related protein
MHFARSAWIFAATLCLLLDARAQTPDVPTFRVPVRLVAVPTLVFSYDARLLHGLDARDFHLFDNGVERSVTLDTEPPPFSAAIAIQTSRAVHNFLPFIARTGSTFDALLLGRTGEAAVFTYGDEIELVRPFEHNGIGKTLAALRATDHQARLYDAALRAIELLKSQPSSRTRILILIGQPLDAGSSAQFESLKLQAQASAATIFTITLPEAGKPFVADTFTSESLSGVSDRGGARFTMDVGKLISVLNRRHGADPSEPFALLPALTGGTQIFAATQRDFENGIASIGYQLRSAYQLSFKPSAGEPGYHNLRVEVSAPGATVFHRPGYWHTAD